MSVAAALLPGPAPAEEKKKKPPGQSRALENAKADLDAFKKRAQTAARKVKENFGEVTTTTICGLETVTTLGLSAWLEGYLGEKIKWGGVDLRVPLGALGMLGGLFLLSQGNGLGRHVLAMSRGPVYAALASKARTMGAPKVGGWVGGREMSPTHANAPQITEGWQTWNTGSGVTSNLRRANRL